MSDILAILAAAGTEQVQRSAWELLAVGVGAFSAFIATIGGLWWLVAPRVKEWARREIAAPAQETHRQVTVNGGRNNPPTLLDEVGKNTTEIHGLRVDFNAHLAASTRESESMWRAIEAVAKAHPDR